MQPQYFLNEVSESGKTILFGQLPFETKEDAIAEAMRLTKIQPNRKFAVVMPVAFVLIEMPEPSVLVAA